MASVLANVSSYVVGVVMVGMLMLAIQGVRDHEQRPARQGHPRHRGRLGIHNVFEAVAIVALFAAVVMLQLTGIRVLWSQARDGQIPAASWMRKVSKLNASRSTRR